MTSIWSKCLSRHWATFIPGLPLMRSRELHGIATKAWSPPDQCGFLSSPSMEIWSKISSRWPLIHIIEAGLITVFSVLRSKHNSYPAFPQNYHHLLPTQETGSKEPMYVLFVAQRRLVNCYSAKTALKVWARHQLPRPHSRWLVKTQSDSLRILNLNSTAQKNLKRISWRCRLLARVSFSSKMAIPTC